MVISTGNFVKAAKTCGVSKFLRSVKMPWFEEAIQSHPKFAVHSSQIEILHEPTDFYQELLTRSSTAKQRITLASLYLGTGDLEKKLVNTIEQNMLRQPNLRVKWLLDYSRGSRGAENSRTLLLPLLKQSPMRCQVSLYHSPKLRGLVKWLLPQRWNEIVALQHIKAYIFDDSILISGANLSNDYFTNRQDRYILIKDCELLADFYDNLFTTISRFSFQLQNDDHTTILSNVHPFKANYATVCSLMRTELTNFWKNQSRNNQLSDCGSWNTLVVPTLQIPQASITYDSDVTSKLLSDCPDGFDVGLASGYFNLTNKYINTIVSKSKATYNILCAHPYANGFLGAKGFSGYIPHVYTYFLNQFYDMVSHRTQQHRISLYEYQKPKWTFHAKGLWLSYSGTQPQMTMVGSPNFGYRSVQRDMESQVLIITNSDVTSKALKEEKDRLYNSSMKVSEDTFHEDYRYVPLWVRAVANIMKGLF